VGPARLDETLPTLTILMLERSGGSTGGWPLSLAHTGGKPLFTHWVHAEYMVGSETKYPAWTHWAHFDYFLILLQFAPNLPTQIPTRYMLSIFKKYPAQNLPRVVLIYPLGSWWVLFECTQPSDRQVSGWVLCKNTQHVPSGYLGEQIVGKM
jgi:hypothetical protein